MPSAQFTKHRHEILRVHGSTCTLMKEMKRLINDRRFEESVEILESINETGAHVFFDDPDTGFLEVDGKLSGPGEASRATLIAAAKEVARRLQGRTLVFDVVIPLARLSTLPISISAIEELPEPNELWRVGYPAIYTPGHYDVYASRTVVWHCDDLFALPGAKVWAHAQADNDLYEDERPEAVRYNVCLHVLTSHATGLMQADT